MFHLYALKCVGKTKREKHLIIWNFALLFFCSSSHIVTSAKWKAKKKICKILYFSLSSFCSSAISFFFFFCILDRIFGHLYTDFHYCCHKVSIVHLLFYNCIYILRQRHFIIYFFFLVVLRVLWGMRRPSNLNGLNASE